MFTIPEIKIKLTFDRKIKKSDLFTIHTSKDCADALRQVFNADTMDWTEEFIVLCLNQRNAVIGFCKISSGGVTGTIADPRVILTVALNCAATTLVLAHNHPSGNLKPSLADENLTRKIKQAASYMDIKVLDHIIITDESYFSFADEGLL